MQEYIKLATDFIIEHPWLKVIIILTVFLFFIGVLNVVINFIRDRVKNERVKSIIHFFKRPILTTMTVIGILFYLKQSEVLGAGYDVVEKILNTILFIYYLLVAKKLNKIFALPAVKKVLNSRKIGKDLQMLVEKFISIGVFIIGVYIILNVWELNLTPLLASAWIMAMAFAMAAKDSLGNIFGWISLFMDSAFKIGDYVVIDGDKRWEVVEIGFRSTRIKTRDDVIVTIPNSVLANATLLNESAPFKSYRIKIPVGVSYGSDLEKAEELLLECVVDVEWIVATPEKRVRVRSLADSSINMDLMVWIKDPSLRGSVKHVLYKKIYKHLPENGVSFPFPQMDIHLDRVEEKI